MKRREFNKYVGAGALTIPFAPSLMAKEAKTKRELYQVSFDSMEKYPNSSTVPLKSNPVFVLTHQGKTEIITLDSSNMVARTNRPRKNQAGYRMVDVDLNWEATGYSKLLDKEVQFKVTDSSYSKMTSQVLNQDFPSKMELNIQYDVFVNGELLQKGLNGRVVSTLDSYQPSANHLFTVSEINTDLTSPKDAVGIKFCGA